MFAKVFERWLMKRVIGRIVCFMAFFGMVSSLFGCDSRKEPGVSVKPVVIPEGDFYSFTYRPGYSDMNGGYHCCELKQTEAGDWIITDDDREEIGVPEIVTTYAVSSEAVAEFAAFLKEKKVLSLENRKDSDDFVTDYSAWSISFVFVTEQDGKKNRDSHSISQYKKYYDKDYETINEIRERFKALYGDMISKEEVTEQ